MESCWKKVLLQILNISENPFEKKIFEALLKGYSNNNIMLQFLALFLPNPPRM
jgi:hypothetical protein